MRPKGPAEILEARRLRAIRLLDGGKLNQRQVAERVGCTPSAVSRWALAHNRGGIEALKVRPAPGRRARLTEAQKVELVKLLQRGPLSLGYDTTTWTTAQIADVIHDHFQVRYHRDHVGRIMNVLGWISVDRKWRIRPHGAT